jgi:CRISPR-associated DxTHG motif protein
MKDRERSTPTKKLLLSFLGLGPRPEPPHYDRVRYSVDDGARVSSLTPLVQAAHVELAGDEPYDELVFFGTGEVETRWVSTGLLEQELRSADGSAPRWRFVRVPDGRQPSELWELFERVRAELARDDVATLHLDLTHGFRVQPMIALSALDLVRSSWARDRVDPPALRVFYGAFEARQRGPEGDVAPIWDMTGVFQAGAWNAALTAVARYGRGDDFKSLAEPIGKARAKQAHAGGAGAAGARIAGAPAELGKRIAAFCDDLATGRVAALFGAGQKGSAPALSDLLRSKELEPFLEELPPLRSTVEWLEVRVAKLCASDLVGEEGTQAMVAYAELCMELERFAEAAAALREGAISLFALRAPRPLAEQLSNGPRCPAPGFLDARDSVERSCTALGREAISKNEKIAEAARVALGAALDAAKLANNIGQLRNDVEHLGHRDKPLEASRVRKQLAEHCAQLADLVRATFVNLSNHPVATWPKEQAAAALALGLGTPADLHGGMPTVPPTATEDEVDGMARDLADRALRQGARGAHVAGDFTLTMALVRELQRRGVRCFAATSERLVSNEEHGPEGAQATREFRFVRWREYSRMAKGTAA